MRGPHKKDCSNWGMYPGALILGNDHISHKYINNVHENVYVWGLGRNRDPGFWVEDSQGSGFRSMPQGPGLLGFRV